jgi:hypothetical protein
LVYSAIKVGLRMRIEKVALNQFFLIGVGSAGLSAGAPTTDGLLSLN